MSFNFQEQTVLVIGDIMLDRYWTGAASRISPEAPVPVVNAEQLTEVLGGAANVANNLCALGAKVHLIGIVGDDDAGKRCQQLLSEAGIESHMHIDCNKPTISKLRVISHNQQMLRLDQEESLQAIDKKPLYENFLQVLPTADVVIASDYAKGTLSNIGEYITACKKHNKKY